MSSGVLWSDSEDQRLRGLARSGLSIRQISLRMSRSQDVIRRHAAKLQIGIAGGRNVMATVDRLVELRLKVRGK